MKTREYRQEIIYKSDMNKGGKGKMGESELIKEGVEVKRNFLEDYNDWFKRKNGRPLWETQENNTDKSIKT